MTRDDLLKLLGGYATGTLTGEEKDLLFEAALDDQELFDALADEQALKEMLDDPECRARLLAVTESGGLRVVPMPAKKARPRWIIPLSIAASVMVIASVTAIYLHRPEPVEMAVVRAPERLDVPAPSSVREQSREIVERQAPEVKALKRGTRRMEAMQPMAEKDISALPAQADSVSAASVSVNAVPPPIPRSAPVPARGVVGGVPGAVAGSLGGFAPVAPPPSFTRTAASPDGQLVLHYAVLKRTAGGDYAPVDPKTEFTAGDEIRLRLEANQSGSISVAESGNILFVSPIGAAAAVTTSTLPLDAGKPLEISFARVTAQPAAMAFGATKQKARAAETEALESRDRLTTANPPALRVTLPLRVRTQ